MSIRKTIITTVVGLTLVALVAPVSANAITIAELQAQIQALMAQLAALQGGTSTPSGSVPAACVGVTFTRNLTIGSTGSDVKCLQTLLNQSASTQIATTGAGSPGSETSYFGGLTLAAVKKYQTANGILPANQVGPLTRAKLNAALGGGSTGPVIIPTGAGLNVSLAYDNPAAGTIVDGQAQAPLAKLTFTNGDNAQVSVTGLKLKRIGISADASLTNVYLFDGATRLTDGASVSSTVISFNNTAGLFTVPAGGSKTITVTADVDGTSGETVGVQVVSAADITSNASSIKGVYPVTGNLMTLATGSLAGVNFAASTTPADAYVDPQEGYTVWQNSVTVTTRAVDMKRISFRKTGSVANSDLQNLKLYVDGVQVGSAMNLDANGYVTFDLTSSPKRLEAGTRVIKLLADIVGGSNLTFQFHLWNVADSTFVDSQYGANVLPQAASASFSKRTAGTNGQTVNSGTITITKMTDSPSGNIVDAASNVTLAKFQLKAAGERVKIESLKVTALVNTSNVSGLRNGMLLANGVQVGSTATLYDPDDSSYDYTTFNLGSSLIVQPGSPVTLEVRADVYDTGTSDTTNSIVNGSTIQIRIEGSSDENNATGLTSSTTIDAPSADISGNSLTVAQGGLTLSKYTAYTDQIVVAPLTAHKLAHYTLTANTTEAVNISAINVALDDVSSYTTNLYVKYGTQQTTVKPTVSASNTWSINYTLPAGSTIDITVYGDVSSLMTGGTGVATVDVDGTSASSSVAANSTEVQGQTINFSSGTFATAFGNTPQNQAVSGGQQVEAGRFKFTSSYQAYTIQELRFTANSNPGAIVQAILKDGSTTIATMPYDNTSGYFNFTGLSIAVPASTSKTLTLVWDLSIPSATASTSGVDTKAALTYAKFLDPSGTVDTATTVPNTANSTYVYRAVPAIAGVNLDNSGYISNGGEIDLYKFKVTAPSQGPVDVKQLKFAVTWSDGGTGDAMKVSNMKLYKDGVDITGTVTIQNEDGYTLEGTTGSISDPDDDTIVVTWPTTYEDTISAGTSTTYTLKGTPSGFRTAGATDQVGTDSIAIQLSLDTAAQTAANKYINVGTTTTSILKLYSTTTGDVSAEAVKFLWSDDSAVAHDADVTSSTNDWYNGYLLQEAPTSETWAR